MKYLGWAAARFALFWGVCAGVTILSFYAIGQILPQISFEQIRTSWTSAPDWFALSTSKNFAFNLAGLIGAVAVGLSAAFGTATLCIRLLLGYQAWRRKQS